MTPIVFVHGFMGGSPQWEGQKTAFGHGKVVAVDLPGFGKNAHLQALTTIAEYADWALRELASRTISHFHLVGHSMGGMVTQEMALRASGRVQRLVLYGTGAQGLLPGRFESIETSKERAIADGAKATAGRIAATWFLEGEDAPAYAQCAQIAACSRLDAILAGLDAMRLWDGRANLSNLPPETLIVWGDRDRTYPWSQTEQLWQSISGANLAVIPQSAHASHLERPELFNRLVAEFFAG